MAEEILKGRYYFLIRYRQRPIDIISTAITKSKKLLLSRGPRKTEDSSVGGERTASNLVGLLLLYKRISGYAVIGNEVCRDLQYIPDIKLNADIDSMAGKSLEKVKSRNNSDLYITKSLDIKSLKKSIDKYYHSHEYSYAVKNAVFSGLVSAFDEILAFVIRTAMHKKPSILNGFSKSIPYSDIVKSQNFAKLQDSVIAETTAEIMAQGRHDQLAWIERFLTKVKLKDKIENFPDFIEILERRNVYVHNDGFPSPDYYRRIQEYTGYPSLVKPGVRLEFNKEYFLNAMDVLLEVFVVLSQAAARRILASTDEEIKNVNDSLNQVIYYQIENERFESAARLSKCLLNCGFAIPDLIERMVIVNRVIAEKKCGRVDEAEKIINSTDWSSTRDEFNLCIHAIREDVDKLCAMIPRLVNSDIVHPIAYFEWPAFDWVRDKPDFWKKLEEVYGEEIQNAGDVYKSVVDDSESQLS